MLFRLSLLRRVGWRCQGDVHIYVIFFVLVCLMPGILPSSIRPAVDWDKKVLQIDGMRQSAYSSTGPP